MKKMKIKQTIFMLGIAMASLSACKKTKVTPDPVPAPVVPPAASGTRTELTKDSIFLYAKEIYLWSTNLPTYEVFNPRKFSAYTSNLDNYEQELFEISKYSSPYEYKNGATYPKYSYIFDQANTNPTAVVKTSSVDLEGNGNDLGIRFGFYGTETNFVIYATAVYQGSPAATAGFVRGDKITKINGVSYGTNFNAQVDAIETAIGGASVKLEGIKSNGTSFNVTLNKTVFKSSPIYKSKVIDAGGKKIGYLAYARFSSMANSQQELDNVFTNFVSNGVTDLVVDLRYNGGGYIVTAEHLIDLIVPSVNNGEVMFSEHYNALMQAGGAQILKNQPSLDANGKIRYQNGRMLTFADHDYTVAGNTTKIKKVGNLGNVKNIVFIVSGNTASASELVINSLKPYMTVKLVGKTTYGKPVGFFPITIENKYDVYYSLFETKNKLGQGGYYDGMTPDYSLSELATSSIMYDFGDVNDDYLKKAIEALSLSATTTSQAKTMTAREKSAAGITLNALDSDVGSNDFKGMIETQHRLKN